MHYVIVGTSHTDQVRSGELASKLESLIRQYSVKLVAEESEAGKITQGKKLAISNGIPWIPIDMPVSEQQAEGIADALDHAAHLNFLAFKASENKTYYPVHANNLRECYWLQQIRRECENRNITDGPVLITCGIIHLEFLSAKAAKHGVAEISKLGFPPGS